MPIGARILLFQSLGIVRGFVEAQAGSLTNRDAAGMKRRLAAEAIAIGPQVSSV
jgi:hypothetical protein